MFDASPSPIPEDSPPSASCSSGRAPRAWLELIRVPNLLSVPGDPLAGFLLAAAATGVARRVDIGCFAAMVSAVCLYVVGLITNDICDLTEDTQARPRRPLPSGRISLARAELAAGSLAVGGLAAAALAGRVTLVVAVVLLGVLVTYNRLAKSHPLLGPFAMGLCRGGSVLLGASAVGKAGVTAPGVLVLAVSVVGYIAAVTTIAAGETGTQELGNRRFLPLFVVCLGGSVVWASIRGLGVNVMAVMPLLGAAAVSARVGSRLRGSVSPAVCQLCVGRLIGALILIQSAAAVALLDTRGALAMTIGGGLLWLVFGRLGRWFYSS